MPDRNSVVIAKLDPVENHGNKSSNSYRYTFSGATRKIRTRRFHHYLYPVKSEEEAADRNPVVFIGITTSRQSEVKTLFLSSVGVINDFPLRFQRIRRLLGILTSLSKFLWEVRTEILN